MRTLLAILILIIGFMIGSCLPISHATPRAAPPQDWHPIVGRRYEHPGSRTRTVLEVWQKGVRYRHDNGHERSCAIETWKRWASPAPPS